MTTKVGSHGATLDPERVGAYLDRIGHGDVGEPDLAMLASLQDAHVRSVPFENLDIHLGRPLSLDVADLARKVIDDRRGGFCFELNGLFRALLASLGYEAWLVEARSREDDGTLGPRFDHARILVELDGEVLLVDVGTGASPRGPIRLDPEPQRVGHDWHRVRTSGGRYQSDQLDAASGEWSPGWSFDTKPRALGEFADRCGYHQTSPESHFTQKPLWTLVTEDGHVTLAGRRLITTSRGVREETELGDPLGLLASRFGVRVARWPG